MRERTSNWAVRALAVMGVGIVACSHLTAASAQSWGDPTMDVINGITTPGAIVREGTIPPRWPYTTSGNTYTTPGNTYNPWNDPRNLLNTPTGVGLGMMPGAGDILGAGAVPPWVAGVIHGSGAYAPAPPRPTLDPETEYWMSQLQQLSRGRR